MMTRLIRQLIPVRLKKLRAHVTCVATGAEGLAEARRAVPDLVLLDVSVPEMDGFEVCGQLRDSPIPAFVPVIFLTGSGQPEEKIRGFVMGAVDYLTKPFEVCRLERDS